ncbi:MAG TPA: polyprenyl synthetase family protein, partial [Candidatus Thermoplasmatota archaeon]
GTEEVLGKPRGSDIVRGKKTLIALHTLTRGKKADAKRLRTILDMPNSKVSVAVVDEAINILTRNGSLTYAEKTANAMIAEAKTYLDALPRSEASDALRALHALADFVIHRDR